MISIEGFKALIINSFPEEICDIEGKLIKATPEDEFYILCRHSNEPILVNQLNRERIQFLLHIYGLLYNQGDTSALSFEAPVEKSDLTGANKSDFMITVRGKTALIVENKNFEVGARFNEEKFAAFRLKALEQLVDKYIRPIRDQSGFDEQFFVSLVIMDPAKFLDSRTNFSLYSDNTKSKAPESSLRESGVYIETYLINSDILSDDFLSDDYIDIFNGATPHHCLPAYVSLNASSEGKVTHESEHPKGKIFKVNSKVKDMKTLPVFNPAGLTGSQNTRDLDLSSTAKGLDFHSLFLSTLFTMYYRYNTASLDEDRTDEQLKSGSNKREVSFRSDKSIIFRTENNLTLISLDIALIDGQHSLHTYFNFYDSTANFEGDPREYSEDKKALSKSYATQFKAFIKEKGLDPSAVSFNVPLFHYFIGNNVILETGFTGSKEQSEVDRIANAQNNRNELEKSDEIYNKHKFSLIGISTIYNNDSKSNYKIQSKKSFVSHPYIHKHSLAKDLISIKEILPFFYIPKFLFSAEGENIKGIEDEDPKAIETSQKWFDGLKDNQSKVRQIQTKSVSKYLETIETDEGDNIQTWSIAGVIENELILSAFQATSKNTSTQSISYNTFIEFAAEKLINDATVDLIDEFVNSSFLNLQHLSGTLKALIKKLRSRKGGDRHLENLISAVEEQYKKVDYLTAMAGGSSSEDMILNAINTAKSDLSNETFMSVNIDLINNINKKIIYFNSQYKKRNVEGFSFYNSQSAVMTHCCASAYLLFREGKKGTYSEDEAITSIANMSFSSWERVVNGFFDKCLKIKQDDINFKITANRHSIENSRNSSEVVNFNGSGVLTIDIIHYLLNSETPVDNYE